MPPASHEVTEQERRGLTPASIICISWQPDLLLSLAYRLGSSFSASLDKGRYTSTVVSCLSSGLEFNPPVLDLRLGSQPICGTQVSLGVLHSYLIQETSTPQVYPCGYRHSSTLVLCGMMAQSSGQVSKTGKKCLTERVGLRHCRYFKP